MKQVNESSWMRRIMVMADRTNDKIHVGAQNLEDTTENREEEEDDKDEEEEENRDNNKSGQPCSYFVG